MRYIPEPFLGHTVWCNILPGRVLIADFSMKIKLTGSRVLGHTEWWNILPGRVLIADFWDI